MKKKKFFSLRDGCTSVYTVLPPGPVSVCGVLTCFEEMA